MSTTALPSALQAPNPTTLVAPPLPSAAGSDPGAFSRMLQAADARRQPNPSEKSNSDGGTRSPTTAARPPAPKPPAREGQKAERQEGPRKHDARETTPEDNAAKAAEGAPAEADGEACNAPADPASLLAGLGLLGRPLVPADGSGVRGRGTLGREALEGAEALDAARGGTKGASGADTAADLAIAEDTGGKGSPGKAFAGLLAAAQTTDRGSDVGSTAVLAEQAAAPQLAPEPHLTEANPLGALAGHGAVPGASTGVGRSAATPAEARLAAGPGSPAFAEQLGSQLSTFVRDGVQHARLQLNPADMGPVTVQIQLDGGKAHMSFAAEHAQTRQALEQALPTLAGSLREAGLTLSGGGVFEQPRQPQPDGGNGQDGGHGNGRGDGRGGRGGGDDGALPAAAAPALRRRGVVDLVA